MVFDDGLMVRPEPEAVDLIELQLLNPSPVGERRSVCAYLLPSHRDPTQPNDIYSALLHPLFVQIQFRAVSPVLTQCILNGLYMKT